MPASIPSSIVYPLIRKLGTGQIMTTDEIAQVCDLINWSVAELYMDPVIEQGFNSGHGEATTGATTLTMAQWRVPTLNDEQDELEIQIEAEASVVDCTINMYSVLDGSSVGLTVTTAGGRNWWVGNLPIKATGEYEDVELEVVVPATATLTVYAVRAVWIPKSSLLAQRYEIESGGGSPTYITPIDTTGLPAADRPLSAGFGRLLLHNLTQLLTRYKRRYYSLSAWGNTAVTTTYLQCPPAVRPRHWALSKARPWPGLVERGIKATFHALIIRDTSDTTYLTILGERRIEDGSAQPGRTYTQVLHRESLASAGSPTPEWITGEFEIPDDIYDAGRPLPVMRIGIAPSYDIADFQGYAVTTVGVQSIVIWGTW